MDIVFNFTWLAAAAQLVGCCIDTGWLLHCNWLASSHLCEYHHFIACCMATAARPPLYHYTFAMSCIDVHKCLLHLLPSWLCCPNTVADGPPQCCSCCQLIVVACHLLFLATRHCPFTPEMADTLPSLLYNGLHLKVPPTTFCHSTAITE